MFVTTDDGCRLHVVPGSPDKTPIVLSNSLGTDVGLWDLQVEPFATHYSVWRYDTRGHGRSDAPPGEYSIDRLGADLIAVMDVTGGNRVDLCGISIGGLTALWVALHAPDRVRRLILANTAAKIGHVELWTERIHVAQTEGMAALADASMGRWFTDGYRAREPETVDRFRATVAATSVVGYTGCCAALRDADLRTQASNVTRPTLVIAGRHDIATPPEAGRWLAERIPGARFAELDAAHISNVECAAAFNHAVIGDVHG
jgi:3-oxoadipate enol-lactonase